MTIGSKIKKLRRMRGMTQEQLTAGTVTRNMLSQIENGSALPSLGTLIEFASRLQVSPGYFLTDEDTLLEHTKSGNIARLKNMYQKGEYKDCIAACSMLFGDEDDDETALLRALCHSSQAKNDLEAGSMKSSRQNCQNALTYCKKTVYNTDGIEAKVMLLSSIANNPLSPMLSLDSFEYSGLLDSESDTDLYHYIKEDTDYNYRNEAMERHMTAKRVMQNGDHQKAYCIMSEIENARLTRSISAFVMFRVYADMEACARSNRDFENAYRLSSKRLSLLSAFKE